VSERGGDEAGAQRAFECEDPTVTVLAAKRADQAAGIIVFSRGRRTDEPCAFDLVITS
jgi:hypothetical protein